SVTLTGTNFTGASAVYFGTVLGTNLQVNSATSITITTPPQAAGTVDVTVGTPSGTSPTSSLDRFTYTAAALPTVSGLSRGTGSTAGGTSVVISGSNFTGAYAVYFGLVAATSFTMNSGTQITATSPPQAYGTYDITVATCSGVSAVTANDRFSYNTLAALP